MTALHVALGVLVLMACANMLGNSSGVLGKPSGVLGKRSEQRQSPRDYCEVKDYVKDYMGEMKKYAQEIIDKRQYKRFMAKRRGCKLNSFLKRNFCVQCPSMGIQDALHHVMYLMNQTKDLVDFVRGRGNIKARDNHIVWRPITRAYDGIDMAMNNANSHIKSSLAELPEVGSRDRSARDAIKKCSGKGTVNEIKRAYIVARDIVDVIDCSETMLGETTKKVC